MLSSDSWSFSESDSDTAVYSFVVAKNIAWIFDEDDYEEKFLVS